MAKENTDKAYVAPEKFSSKKVLTQLGKMPLFKNTEVVQNIRKHQGQGIRKFTNISRALTAEKYGNSGQ
ncbi:hypothetical protein KCP77_07270 [Salmonella enterica subsp. enterica]|nr:hypothetical protein KCP77_07270 [Salmonella enterica subsp. enterica]